MEADKSNDKKRRAVNWTCDEEEALANAIVKYSGILKGRFNPLVSNAKKQQAWESVKQLVNSVGGYDRDVEAIKKKYHQLNSTAKKTECGNRKSYKQTGGGPSEEIPLTSVQSKLVSVMPEVILSGIEGGFDIGVGADFQIGKLWYAQARNRGYT